MCPRERERERDRVCPRERDSARERASVSERERERERERQCARDMYRLLISYVIKVQRTIIARVNTVAGKITEPWVAFFLGYFYNVPRPPKVYVYT